MSDTPIAEQLAAALDMPWPLRRSWCINGVLFEDTTTEGEAVASEEDLAKLREAMAWKAQHGEDASKLAAIHEVVAKAPPEPDED